MPTDLAGVEHWDRAWSLEEFPKDVEPRSTSVWGYRDRLLHRAIERVLARRSRGLRLVELGCARSAWLPYFAREFGCRVCGLDYSPIGAEQTSQRLEASGIAGEVRCADLFDAPPEWQGAFDVVTWFGVAEHFPDTTGVVRAASRLLKPGGVMITEIPNMAGIVGLMQRWFNRPVYDIHVPLTAEELARHHAAAGLEVVRAEYVVPLDFGIVDIEQVAEGTAKRIKERLLFLLRVFAGAVWWIDQRVGPMAPGRLTGGFVLVAAEKPIH